MTDTDPISEAIIAHWGERCDDTMEGCPICDAWAAYDRLCGMEAPVQEPPSPGVTAGATRPERLWLWPECHDDGMDKAVSFPDQLYPSGSTEYIRADLAPAPVVPAEGLADYDAGLLNDFGGGNVEWWQDYLRAEIGRANDFWRDQVSALRSAPPVGVWPDFIAPPKYENPCEGWEDPRLPDFRLIWETARALGYAIGLHGSMKRDCDLIAAPWVDNPAHPDDLIKALCVALNATQVGGVEAKPVGRIAVILQIDGYVKHIDLSIMPAPPVGARVTGWQQIETAPHEELVVLGWQEDGAWKQEIALASAGERFPNGYSNRWTHGRATHWMPLPEPPAALLPAGEGE